MKTELDLTISKMGTRLSKIKYTAIKEMTEIVAETCPQYSRKLIRKAVIYYYFD